MITIQKLTRFSDATCTAIADMYCNAGWGTAYKTADIRKIYQNSSYSLIALDESQQIIGLLRALSDNTLTTWLAELMVVKSRQQQGIGTALLTEFINNYKHTTIYCEVLKGAEVFFNKFGIIPRKALVACSSKVF